MKTNDLDWIIQDNEELNCYLENVTNEQFVADVKALIAKSADKQVLKEAIKKLQELI